MAMLSNNLVQNVVLVWLDDSNVDSINTIAQLRHVINSIDKYTNSEECIEFLEITDNENICMIISGSLGPQIVPRVHDMIKIHSIFIIDGNEGWTKEWPKIKGVFTEITPICEALKKIAQQCEQDAISISILTDNENTSNQHPEILMYTQILKEILLTIKFEQKQIVECIQYCRDVFVENEEELQNVNKFEETYRDETPIWWYTHNCFLYPMLNRAVRTMNVDVIIKMGFFIGDLHRQIEQLHTEQFTDSGCNTAFKVYRGQTMPKIDFEHISKAKGGLLSFNNFLSTSKNCNVSLAFANGALENPEIIGIVFVMNIDPSKSTVPFASKGKEDEVLFSIHMLFRIGGITSIDGNNRLFQVELTSTNDNDNDLFVLTDYIRQEIYTNEEGWLRLSSLLLKMGQFEKAEQVYETLLEQTTDEDKRVSIYGQVAWTKYSQGEYTEALEWYEKALEIYEKTRSPTDLDLARCYNDVGLVHENMGNYSEAISFYEKALAIRQQSLSSDHPDLCSSYNTIALAATNMGEYPKALSFYEKAFAIRLQSLPPNHPSLSESYSNIGNVHSNMGDYVKALSVFEKALEIKQESLPPNHPGLSESYNNIGDVYTNIGDYPKALSFQEKALEIKQQYLPLDHPDLADTYDNIGFIYEKMNNYSEARSYYERAMNIGQRSLPPNHPNLEKWRNNFERMSDKL